MYRVRTTWDVDSAHRSLALCRPQRFNRADEERHEYVTVSVMLGRGDRPKKIARSPDNAVVFKFLAGGQTRPCTGGLQS